MAPIPRMVDLLIIDRDQTGIQAFSGDFALMVS